MSLAQEMRRLRAEHAALVTLSRLLMELIAAPHPPRATELAAVRGMLRDTLVRHLKCEDWALYPRLKKDGDPALSRLSDAFAREMGHIADDFAAYDARWTPDTVAANWAGFCAETTGILDALAMRIERENHTLYPAAEAMIRPDHAA
ncbi:MAG: hemerythrin domain-containing protein [Sphingopyxis sp.]|uniref:hemerythrin domain-containing protein n=1 Tax=Sphingopyxis sp. TaxID=1908224 RepID=UPI003D81002A